MDNYFTVNKIQSLIDKYNWVLARQDDLYFLHQKDKEYMKTKLFTLSDKEAALIKEKPRLGRGG